jgi:flagellar biosynthesis GTPase FlhF
MEKYTEKGKSRKECELKIYEKYKRPFYILTQRDIKIGGILGLFSSNGVEVEFYFSPIQKKNHLLHGNYPYASSNIPNNPDISERQRFFAPTPDLETEKRKVLAAAGKNYDQIAASGREASQQILDSLKEIKEKIETGGQKEEHISFVRAEELL